MSDRDMRAADRAAALGDAAAADQAFAEHVRRGDLGVAAEMLLRFPEQSSRALAGLIPAEVLLRLSGALRPSETNGVAQVRRRPAMYVGTVHEGGLQRLFRTVLDDALARTLDYGTRIEVEIARDGGVVVEDDGRPLPLEVDQHPSGGEVLGVLSRLTPHALERELHAIGWYHANGLAVACALSERFALSIRQHGAWHGQAACRGIPVTPIDREAERPGERLNVRVRFLPDRELFRSNNRVGVEGVRGRLREVSFLRPDLRLGLSVEGVREDIHEPRGLAAWPHAVEPTLRETFSCEGRGPLAGRGGEEVRVAAAFGWSPRPEYLTSWANLESTVEGGTHVGGLRRAVQDGGKAWFASRGRRIRGPRFTAGLIGGVSVLLERPEFGGPTRGSLITPGVERAVYSVVQPAFRAWLDGLSSERAQTVVRLVADD